MGRQSVFLVIFLCCHILLVNRAWCTQKPSEKGEFDMETHTKLLDKSSIAQFEDILPGGTIPSHRLTNTDLMIKDEQVSEATEVTNRPHTYLAVAQTKIGPEKYTGAGGDLKLDNPKAVGQQYSASRIRISARSDNIEAGWRVDPDLYGDSQTRFFIRTDVPRTHCFNTLCPAFIKTWPGFHLNTPIGQISKPGGPVFTLRIFIVRDNTNGNWILKIGTNLTEVGYWPRHLFKGLGGLADVVEWGGEVYSPPGTPLPPMGSGTYPKGKPSFDGTVCAIKVLDERGQENVAPDLEIHADFKLYSVIDAGVLGIYYRRTILYGGPGHS